MKAAALAILFAAAGAASMWMALKPDGARDLLISDVYARPLETGGLAAVLAIDNTGQPDRLVAVSSPLGDASLYSPIDPEGVPVQSGQSSLALDSAHIQLAAQSAELGDGSLVPLTLTFANAGDVAVKARLSDPTQQGAAQQYGLFGIADICVVEDGEPAPAIELSVTSTPEGWKVTVSAEDFTFSDEYLGLYHIPGMGHGHLYVGGMKLGRMMSPNAHIGQLPPGRHEVRVTLNTNDHRAYVVDDEPVTAIAMIDVP